MERRNINANKAVEDIRSGYSDMDLMEKYKLSARGLHSLFGKLVKAGVLEQKELDSRGPLSERTVRIELYTCPSCKMPQFSPFTECPQCGIIVSKFTGEKPVEAAPTQKAPEFLPAPKLNGIKWQFQTAGQITSSVAKDHGVICFGSWDSTLYCLDEQTGVQQWRFNSDGPIHATPLIRGAAVYVGSMGGSFYAVDLISGQEKWRFDAGAAIYSAATAYNDIIYFGANDGTVYALDAAAGNPVGRFQAGKAVKTMVEICEGAAVVGSTDGTLYALE